MSDKEKDLFKLYIDSSGKQFISLDDFELFIQTFRKYYTSHIAKFIVSEMLIVEDKNGSLLDKEQYKLGINPAIKEDKGVLNDKSLEIIEKIFKESFNTSIKVKINV